MRYLDFEVQIHSVGRDYYRVSVLSSPAGGGEEVVPRHNLPKGWLRGLGFYLTRDVATKSPESTLRSFRTAIDVGTKLYQAIFVGKVEKLLERSLAKVYSSPENQGLRIHLILNTDDASVRSLQRLPWELLARDWTFLNLSERTPVVRSLVVAQPKRALDLPIPFRVLAAQAQPRGVAELGLGRELAEMAAAESRGGFEIVLCRASRSEINRYLNCGERPVHVLHFLGHGELLRGGRESALVFEDSEGSPDRITGEDLAQILTDSTSVRLLVLNACNSGRSSGTPRGRPFEGIAAALLQAGFPAVLAMQEVISDESAIQLSRIFYRELAFQPIEVALARARRAIHAPRREWAVPSLFMRAATPEIRQDTDPLPHLKNVASARRRQAYLASQLGIAEERSECGIRFRLIPSGIIGEYVLPAPVYLAVEPLTIHQWCAVIGEEPASMSSLSGFRGDLSVGDVERFLSLARSEDGWKLDFPWKSEWGLAAWFYGDIYYPEDPFGLRSFYGDVYQICRAEDGLDAYERLGGRIDRAGQPHIPRGQARKLSGSATRMNSLGFRPVLRSSLTPGASRR
jgi:hypothetical protein